MFVCTDRNAGHLTSIRPPSTTGIGETGPNWPIERSAGKISAHQPCSYEATCACALVAQLTKPDSQIYTSPHNLSGLASPPHRCPQAPSHDNCALRLKERISCARQNTPPLYGQRTCDIRQLLIDRLMGRCSIRPGDIIARRRLRTQFSESNECQDPDGYDPTFLLYWRQFKWMNMEETQCMPVSLTRYLV